MPKQRAAPPAFPRPEAVPVTSLSPRAASPDSLVLLPLLLAGSGCAALIYEIVWFQLLQLVIGSSAVSLGLLLAFYMGGLCLGGVLFARLVPTRLAPRRVYAFLELGIAAFGILALFGVPLIGRLYLFGPANGLAGLLFRGVIAGLCLVPPAVLMGGTFPAASRWTGGERVSRLGLLYSANTGGAVAGCILAGFYLLRLHDLAVASYVAAVINLAGALIAWRLPSTEPAAEAPIVTTSSATRAQGFSWIYASIAISGLAALGAEVVWTRLLSLLLGATVYTFSIILAVFLAGLWAGSTAGSFLVRRLRDPRGVLADPLGRFADPRLALAACQILIAVCCAWTAYTVARSLPYWPVDPALSIDPWMNFELDTIRCAFAVLPATLFWGASFPLALACAAAPGEDPARLSGEVYAANTTGAVIGALLFSLLLIPSAGTAGSQQVLVWTAVLGAAAALIPLQAAPNGLPRLAAGCGAALVAGLIATALISPVPWQLIAYGRRVAPILRAAQNLAPSDQAVPLFVGEGVSSSVVIAERYKQLFFFVSGKSEASSGPVDMRLQRMMGHLPALAHSSNLQSVLVVGFGAGVTSGSFIPYPEVRKITVCELEALIPPASGKYFAPQNNSVIFDPRTQVVYDDARHFILTTPEKYDVITTDPIHPWVRGTATLYSKDYYELVRQHLKPGGVVAQWLPLYESDEATVRSELATFFSVFPNGTVWSNFRGDDGYDLVLLGQASDAPASIDLDALDQRLKQPAYSGVAKSLEDTGFTSATDLFSTYAGRASDLEAMTAGAAINNDLSMRLQYMAGLGLNSDDAARLYREILSYRKFPDGVLTGSSDRFDALRTALGRATRTF